MSARPPGRGRPGPRCRTVSHGIACRRTLSHGIARRRIVWRLLRGFRRFFLETALFCRNPGGFCQNRASGGPLDKQVYSLDFLNGSREPCGAKQAPRGGRVGPPGGGDVEIATRPVGGFAGPWTGAGTPRGQPGGLPTGCPHPCPPTAPPSPHFHRWRPAAAIGATTLIFFQPLSGAAAPARFACQPLPLPNRDRRGSRPEWPGEPRRGAPGGSKGRPTAGQGGGTPPPLGGSDYPPFGGLLEGEGEPPGGRGNPVGVPRGQLKTVLKKTQKNAALIDLRE